MNLAIDAVLFDFDHTLGVDNHLEQRVIADMIKRHCEDGPDDHSVSKSLERYRAGGMPIAAMLGHLLGAHKDEREALVAEFKSEALARLPGCLNPFPGATSVPRTLRGRGLIVAILSNGWSELQHAKASAIGFEGPVFVSEEIEAWKPQEKAFRIVAQRLGVAPQRCAYVGDSPSSDVAGSKAAGMTAVWADLEGASYPEKVTRPDHRITLLDQLEALFAVAGQAQGRADR